MITSDTTVLIAPGVNSNEVNVEGKFKLTLWNKLKKKKQ